MNLNEKNLVKYGVILGEPTMVLNDFMAANISFSRKGFDYISTAAVLEKWWKLAFFWKRHVKTFPFKEVANFKNEFSFFNTTRNKILEKMAKLPFAKKKKIKMFLKSQIFLNRCLNKKKKKLNKIVIGKKNNFLYISTETNLTEYVRSFATSQYMFYSAGKWTPGLLSNFSKRRWYIESNLFQPELVNVFMPKLPNYIFLFNFNPKLSLSKEVFASAIPMFAICDTNSDPRITYALPGNDNSIFSIYFYSKMLNKVLISKLKQ